MSSYTNKTHENVPDKIENPNHKKNTVDKVMSDGSKNKKSQGKANEVKKNAGHQCIHVVKKGESLCLLATRYLGSGSKWSEIMTLNGKKTAAIVPGEKLRIPCK